MMPAQPTTPEGWRDLWSRRLLTTASRALANTPLVSDEPVTEAATAAFIAEFQDEHGHRRAVDRYLLAHALGHPHLALATSLASSDPTANSTDIALWAALCAGRDPSGLIATHGPLIHETRGVIETDTEAELSALHALWWHAKGHPTIATGLEPVASPRKLSTSPLIDRCMDAARHAVDVLQPDNATCHPWAIAVFVELWLQTGDLSARLYAETLEHNSLIAMGRPDRFSAVLLLDAARMLAPQAG